MRDFVKEAAEKLRSIKEPGAAWCIDPAASRRIQAEINEGLEDSSRRSREIQARSEEAASKFYLTY